MENNKVLFVSTALYNSKYAYAGREKMFVWLANTLAEEGMDVTICTMYDKERCPKYSPKVKAIYLGVKYYSNFYLRTTQLFTLLRWKLKKIIRNYDTVVSFGDITFRALISLRRTCKFKLLVSERGDPNNKNSRLSKQGNDLLKYADTVVFQTTGAQSYYPDSIKRKSVVIPNAIEIPEARWERANSKKGIAYVGRIDFWQKRLDVLIEAFSIVSKKHPEYILDVYGDGEMDRLKGVCEKLDVMETVVLHGVSRDVNEKLLEDEIFVITSDFEGIPNSLLEAMALGMPVVSTNCSPGGAAMLIDDGINGRLVDCGNSEQVAEAINDFIENPLNADVCARNAREKMKDFEPRKIIKLWMNAINQK